MVLIVAIYTLKNTLFIYNSSGKDCIMEKMIKEKLLNQEYCLLKDYIDLDYKIWQFNNLTQKIKVELIHPKLKKNQII